MEDGVWYLNGKKQQLDITEVSRNNASHGLLRNASYELVDESEFSVTLEAAVFPQHGYPFLLRHRVRYELAADLGLVVRQLLINDSQEPAPFVLGAHPYLRLGERAQRGAHGHRPRRHEARDRRAPDSAQHGTG